MKQSDEESRRRFVGSWAVLGFMAMMALISVIINNARPSSQTIPTIALEATRQDPVRLVTAYVTASADVVRENNPLLVADLVDVPSAVWRDIVQAADDRRRSSHTRIPVLDRMVVESVAVSGDLAVVTTREQWTLMTVVNERSTVSRATARYAYRLRRTADGWRIVEALTIEAVRSSPNG
jgi:ketosteroid isomerase-like protein